MTCISIISACNNNCDYCFQKDSYHKQPDMLQFDEILKIFEWAKGSPKVGILGGEATLHPECYRICKAASLRFPTVFFTNLLCEQKLLSELIKLNMAWLVNTNTRKELQSLFDENISYLNKVNPDISITYGTTLTGDLKKDEEYIEKLIKLGKKYPNLVKYFRLALATPCHDKKFSLINYDESVLKFYSILEKENLNQAVFFDCSVNYCQLSKRVMNKIKSDSRTHNVIHSCGNARIDIMADRSVNFCGSTPSDIFSELKDYRMFKNWVECQTYIENFVINYMKKYNYICKNVKICTNKECSGTCFAITANLVKEELSKNSIIRSFHQLRRDLFS